MFDKTFFKFAFGLLAIIATSLGVIYISGYLRGNSHTATVAEAED
jgi:hypothetical protein